MKYLITLLAEHDWYYCMSDDPRWYDEGLERERKIRNELQKYEPSQVLEKLDELKAEVAKMYNLKKTI